MKKDGLYHDLLRRGFIPPEDQEPCIDNFEFYIDAFRELSTSRPVGLELAAIPFTAIAEYFRIYELQDFDEFAGVIRMMDTTFIELNEETRKSEGDKNAAGNGNANTKNPNHR